METKTADGPGNRQTASRPVLDIACLSAEEKAALLEKTLAELEQKNRELEIEAALERVRTRAMAMHHSDELTEVLSVVFEQFDVLHITPTYAALTLVNLENNNFSYRLTGKAGKRVIAEQIVSLDSMDFWQESLQKWKAGNPDLMQCYEIPQPMIPHLFAVFGEIRAAIPEDARPEPEDFPDGLFVTQAYCKFGYLGFGHSRKATEEEKEILQRMATEFGRVYQRFLDLQRAEAQAREAMIEAALERVRAKAMAMRRPEDLADTIKLAYQQLGLLNLTPRRCGMGLIDKDSRVTQLSAMNTTEGGERIEIIGDLKLEGHPVLEGIYENWLCQKEYHPVLRGGEIKEYEKALRSQVSLSDDPQFAEQYGYFFPFPDGSIYSWTGSELGEEELKIYRRFTAVLSLTYKRYKDLAKAEAAAREAQIEAALERVRARTMAMQRSEELSDVATVLFQQVKALDVSQWACGFCIWDIGDTECMWYPGSPDGVILAPARFPLTGHPVFRIMDESRKRGDELYILEKEGELQADHYRYMMTLPGVRELLQDMLDAGFTIPAFQVDHYANFAYGNLIFITYEHFPEMHDIFKRFAKVFEQTYTRFLDLQKAEAAAKQANIEASLERVRARAMAMQTSDELNQLVALLFDELTRLDLILSRCIIWIFEPASFAARLWMANSEDKARAESFHIPFLNHPYYKAILRAWRQREAKWVYVLQGKNKRTIDDLLLNETELSRLADAVKAGIRTAEHTVVSGTLHNFGMIEASGPVPHSEDQLEILYRFGKVFDLTYTRFNDLQKAEAQAREATRQASIDRVRAEIASMRTTADLERITPLIWKELMALGVPFVRCGVFIMDDAQRTIHTFLSTPDGKAIAAFHLPYAVSDNIAQMVDRWRKKERYTAHWDKNDFLQFADALVEQGAFGSREVYMKTLPPGRIYLHYLPFVQGMLYVGNTAPLTEEELALVGAVAAAFSTAYARYEDFSKLEEAKSKIEKTFNELKATQQQLIQSEKMASLGELTAGIAHEIQNPLNFVNNFSDVNKELVAELKQEADKGNLTEVKALATEIEENEQKISHHGKRADAIVKGMLQHSRVSTGQKEPADLNKLAEEYLRLAYHGWRAKDKTFNVAVETHFDATIEKIPLVAQDIGRVILNLINNAFYAVSQKAKQAGNGYAPVVSVTTKKLPDRTELKVSDNGNGIPQTVVDKIFQPFFTTKPTGEGTGLGLSLSYDIVTKQHGGNLTMNTKEGEFTEFTIQLPLKTQHE
jgi:signal transduction histidine kinase